MIAGRIGRIGLHGRGFVQGPGTLEKCRGFETPRGGPQKGEAISRRLRALGGAALAFIGKFWFRVNVLPVGVSDARQDLIHGVLDARIRTMKPACRLGCKLAEHIPVLHGV
jgi:hypothetical protein